MMSATEPESSSSTGQSSCERGHRREYLEWSRPGASGRQRPEDELLAEHHVMSAVLLAMEEEARRTNGGAVLRQSFWSQVVEFINEFVHKCHRVKESTFFFPTLVRSGLIEDERSSVLEKEHEIAHDLTEHLWSRAFEGDWEGVVRLVSAYVYFMRPHMRREEDNLIRHSLSKLSDEDQAALRRGFQDVEARAMCKHSRAHYVDVARVLCRAAGVEYPLATAD